MHSSDKLKYIFIVTKSKFPVYFGFMIFKFSFRLRWVTVMLVTESLCWWLYSSCSWLFQCKKSITNIFNRSPRSQSCHQDDWSPFRPERKFQCHKAGVDRKFRFRNNENIFEFTTWMHFRILIISPSKQDYLVFWFDKRWSLREMIS